MKKEKPEFIFQCHKCQHELYVDKSKIMKMIKEDCPECGEEPEENILEKICILAKDNDGKRGSFSLQELCDMGRTIESFSWVLTRMCGYEEGNKITEEQIRRLVEILPRDSYVRLK